MFFQQLKIATQTQHKALESLMGLPERLQTFDDYQVLLQKMWGLYTPLEQAIQNIDLYQLYKGREKTPALYLDLQAVGRSDSTIAALPQATALPSLSTTAELVGWLYVIEGSTLGGQLISRYLQSQLGIDCKINGHFFYSYGPETGSKWKQFKGQVNQLGLNEADQQVSIDSAQVMFQAYHDWMQQESVYDTATINS